MDENLIGSDKEERPRSISCFAWNKEGTQLALSPNNQEVWIYNTQGSDDPKTWTRSHTLDQHSGFVSGIDWSFVHGQLVTCGHDRNAYVWRYNAEKDEWKPTLVILHIDRAATAVKWSPCGKKFAIASGAKCVPICYFEANHDWWVSKVIKKHKSTVLSVDWSPNSRFVVTGGCDKKVRIFSAYVKDVDGASEEDALARVFPNGKKFGELMAEFDLAKAWVHSVAWSPSGSTIAFAAHSSLVGFISLVEGGAHTSTVKSTKGLPFLNSVFVSEHALVAVGWDNKPALFVGGPAGWEFQEYLDKEEAREAKKAVGAFGAAKAMFAAKDSMGMEVKDQDQVQETVLKTKHQNTITAVLNNPTKRGVVTTVGIDGKLIQWNLATVAGGLAKCGL